MLILSRNIDESIRIYTSDGLIEITICNVNGKQVKVGIDAPDAVNIVRSEIDYFAGMTPQDE